MRSWATSTAPVRCCAGWSTRDGWAARPAAAFTRNRSAQVLQLLVESGQRLLQHLAVRGNLSALHARQDVDTGKLQVASSRNHTAHLLFGDHVGLGRPRLATWHVASASG